MLVWVIPGVGGIPLTEAISLVPSSLKMIWLAEPPGPLAGVVWFRLNERRVLFCAINPNCWSGV